MDNRNMDKKDIKFKICNEEQLNGFGIDPGAIWFSADTNLLSFDIIDNDGNEVRKSLKVKPEEIFDESSFVKKEDYQNLFVNQDPSSGQVIDSSKLDGKTWEEIQTYIEENVEINSDVLSQYREIKNNNFDNGLNVTGSITNNNKDFFISGRYGNIKNKIYTNLKLASQKIRFCNDEGLLDLYKELTISSTLSDIANIKDYINKYFKDSSGQIYQVKSMTWTKPNLNIECWKIINNNNNDDFLFQIGNGTSDIKRSNACLIDNNGNAYFSGKVFSEKEKILATIDNINNLETDLNKINQTIDNIKNIQSSIQNTLNNLSSININILSVKNTGVWDNSPETLGLVDDNIYFSKVGTSSYAIFFQSKQNDSKDKKWFRFRPTTTSNYILVYFDNDKWNTLL